MSRSALFAVVVFFSAAVHAAPETYVIDASQTATEFSYRALGVATQTHRFERISGKVVLDPAAGTGSADVTIDATSLSTANALFGRTMQAADFFDTARYPVITFRSTRMTLDGEQLGMAGDLTIKGVTRPVTLAISQFQCQSDPALLADVCGARARVTIKRSDFNMGAHAFLASDEVMLNLAIKALKTAPYVQLASREPSRY